MDIKIARLLAENHGELPYYSNIGDYPMYYLTKDNRILCPQCANAILLGEYLVDHIKADDIVDYQVNWDNHDLTCFSNHKIETATLEFDEEEEGIELDED